MDKKYKILPETKHKLANGRIVFRRFVVNGEIMI